MGGSYGMMEQDKDGTYDQKPSRFLVWHCYKDAITETRCHHLKVGFRAQLKPLHEFFAKVDQKAKFAG